MASPKKNTRLKLSSFDENLENLQASDLRNLIRTLSEKHPETKNFILQWLSEQSSFKQKPEQRPSAEEMINELWQDARLIISEFNEFGGGPEDEEETCYDYLNEIQKLFNENKEISFQMKQEFMDELFEEYNQDNSGFDDVMMDTCYAACKTNVEWLYLVKKLEEHPSDWRKKLIMSIHKDHLSDNDAYLAMRKKNLRYGMDYWDLVDFYNRKGDKSSGVKIAEEGLKKGEGRLTELFQYLSDYYYTENDQINIERIVSYAIQKNCDIKEMLDSLLRFYKKNNDYEKAKKTILSILEYLHGPGYIKEVRAYQHYK